jgi:hypothetical protein
MKKVDLSDLKAGDKAWSSQNEHGKVTAIDGKSVYVEFDSGVCVYFFIENGRIYQDDTYPTLFHSEQEFREYWGLQRDIDAPLTKREQFAMAAMQGMLSEEVWCDYTLLADKAVNAADALLTKLNEKP